MLRSILVMTVAALTLSTQACTATAGGVAATPPPVPSSSPSPVKTSPTWSPSPSGSDTASSHGDVFSGTREVAISMESGPPAYLIVRPDGKVIGEARLTERSVFVLVPAGDGHRIRTAGGDGCLTERAHADGPATLVATDCEPEAAEQLFRFVRTDDRDSQGRRNYRITTATGLLTFSSLDGLHVQSPDRDGPVTGFAVTDQGPA